MISAVIPPQPQVLPQGPLLQPPSVKERAAAGYFRDIALWLNQPLTPHGIFVQVQADRPGCLQLVVEFRQPPVKDRLLRFLCHRVWLLNSELIEGIWVIARPLGHRRVLWQQRVRIVTPALKRRQSRLKVQAQRQAALAMPPKIRPPRPAKTLSRQRLQTLRAFVLSGSAVAAFVMGCLLEVIISAPSPSLPQFSAQSEVLTETELDQGAAPVAPVALRDSGEARPVSAPGRNSAGANGNRPTVVDTALEPVGVITHQAVTPAPTDDVTLLFGGDISLDDIAPDSLTAPGGFFADVAEYDQADLALVNLATPLATAATNLQEGLRHQTRTDAVDLLVNSGVDVVNLTHSSLMDYGAEGLNETLTTLDSKGLYRIGAGRNALEARRPEVLDVKGKRIAYLSYAMGGNNAAHDTDVLKERAGASDKAIAKEVETFKAATAFKDRAGFNAQNMPEIVADIQALRDEVDWIVVNFRWVDHLSEQPNFMQTNLARLAIDQGADVVVGYHPTVIQGGEIYKGRPIAYSLGDFVFRPDEPVENQDSAVLKVALKDDQMRVELVPVRVQDSHPKTLSGNDSQQVLQRIEQASSQFDKPLKSPVVLDLKAQEAPPETVSDPSSPFVSPDAEDILPVDLEAEPTPESKDRLEEETESEDTLEDSAIPTPGSNTPEAVEDSSEPTGSVDEPAAIPGAEQPSPAAPEPLEMEVEFDGDLEEWGPKVSPEQQEFKPVPPERSGGTSQSTREPVQSQSPSGNSPSEVPVPLPAPVQIKVEPVATVPLVAPQPAALADDAEAETWADTIPETPIPSPGE
ncbi:MULTISPECIES: CapA family protein [Cyanophyceae]|uniref:CapA family protein n=1 Tax=Cyanophyceae TaxID=3028117 RepID=UPI0016837434|nr:MULTISPECIES: CapA family protein [Cyanophyceae]MBD1914532.1 CapA family protein [Phormidium sp. FACHB-77]MBD2029678.1 CapA family protein [Phormidium sp. FACHB-322]MBD2049322.1 CapA family protein [Leptolyngbya sp. FACHB-60]